MNQPPEKIFTTKPVEKPILDSGVRERLSPSTAEPILNMGGLKGFYGANKIYVWAIILGLLIIGVLIILIFKPDPKVEIKEANVEVNIEAPETVPSGSEVVFAIKAQNNDSQKLVELQLELVYPEGVGYISSSLKPQNLSGSVFKVPDLITGQNAVIFVKAKAVGNLNDSKKIVVKLHYKYGNFNSEFIKETLVSVRLVASDIVLELTGPSRVTNAQLVIYNLKYKNNSKNEIKNARLKINYPDGFVFGSATPPPDSNANLWNLSSLASGGEGEITVTGSFRAVGQGESKTATAEFLVLGQNGEYFTQGSSEFTTGIESFPLVVFQEVETQEESSIAPPGGSLSFKINYRNNSNIGASGVNIIATLNSKSLDLSTLRAEGGLVNNNTITWNASGVKNLEQLAPSESGELFFVVDVKNPASRDAAKNLSVVSYIKIKSNEYDSFFPGNELEVKISSPAKLLSYLQHKNGELPPKQGKSTNYAVSLELSNSSNDFSDAILTAFVPLGPSGFDVGSVSGSEKDRVEFDSSTGKLTWKVGNLAAHVGKFSEPRILTFNVKIIPSASMVNQAPILVKDIRFQAKDVFTLETVFLDTSDITTASLAGEDGYLNGQVQP